MAFRCKLLFALLFLLMLPLVSAADTNRTETSNTVYDLEAGSDSTVRANILKAHDGGVWIVGIIIEAPSDTPPTNCRLYDGVEGSTLIASGTFAGDSCNFTDLLEMPINDTFSIGTQGSTNQKTKYNNTMTSDQVANYLTFTNDAWDSGPNNWANQNYGIRNVIIMTNSTGTNVTTTLNLPTNNTVTSSTPLIFNVTSVGEGTTLSNVTLYVWNATMDIVNQTTTTLTGSTAQAQWSLFDLLAGRLHWNALTCITTGECAFAEANNTVQYGYTLNAETFNATAGDLTTQGFTLNITLHEDVTIANANLNYNGTTYTSTSTTVGNDTIFTTTVDIPAVTASSEKTFFWNITLLNAVTARFTTSEQTQTVTPNTFGLCADPVNHTVVNFTIFDEAGGLVTSDFKASFEWSLGGGGTTKNASFDLSGASNYTFCVNPNNTFIVSSKIEVSNTDYEVRTFDFSNEAYNNILTNKELYLLNSTASTSFIVFVRDSTFTAVSGAIVKVERFYPATNEWIEVESLQTNVDGKTLGHFITEDVDYRFKVYVNDVLSLTTLSTKVFCESSPCTITLTLPAGAEDGLDFFEDITGVESTLVYTSATSTVTYTYLDNSDDSLGGRLEVISWNPGDTSRLVVCNVTSTESSGVLNCDLSGYQNGTYLASGYIDRTGDLNKLDKRIVVLKTANAVSSVGLDGILWAAFAIMSIALLGLFKPVIAIVFAVAGVIVISLTGFVSIPIVSLVSITAIGGILVWEMRKR